MCCDYQVAWLVCSNLDVAAVCRKQAGYCFVEFASPNAAHFANLQLNGKIVPNSRPVSSGGSKSKLYELTV